MPAGHQDRRALRFCSQLPKHYDKLSVRTYTGCYVARRDACTYMMFHTRCKVRKGHICRPAQVPERLRGCYFDVEDDDDSESLFDDEARSKSMRLIRSRAAGRQWNSDYGSYFST